MKKYVPILIIVLFFLPLLADFLQTKASPADKKKEIVVDLYQSEGWVAFLTNIGISPDSPTPDDKAECDCKGTGYITHGDGHRTPCPCEKCTCKKTTSEAPACTCETCNCEDCVCKKKEQTTSSSVKLQDIYTFEKITATWCGPCKVWDSNHKPTLVKDGYKVTEVDYDTNKQYCQLMKIKSLPSVIVFKNGVRINTKEDDPLVNPTAQELLNFIKKDSEE